MFGLRVKGEGAFRVDVQAFCGAHLSNMSQNETYFFGTAEFFSHYQMLIILIRIFLDAAARWIINVPHSAHG